MKSSVILLFLAIFNYNKVLGQIPQAFSYQGIARNAIGNPVQNQNIAILISILANSASGSVLYSENHSTTTNNFGIFTLSIGNGNVSSGVFTSIDWAIGTKFLKIEIDPSGGSNYQITGTTQLISVPYALYAGNGSKWTNNGPTSIFYNNDRVAVGSSILNPAKFTVSGQAGGSLNSTILIRNTQNAYGAHINFDNTANPGGVHWAIGSTGPSNFAGEAGSLEFHLVGDSTNRMVLKNNGNLGIMINQPRSRLHVSNGDVYLDNALNGIILRSPNGQCWRVTIDNGGNLIRTTITCP